ncbi:MAG: hypothetical protein GY930_12545 [bacterium]|nr:hypothetical protein [bacterium]
MQYTEQTGPSAQGQFDLGWACFKGGATFTGCLILHFSSRFLQFEVAWAALLVGACMLGAAQLLYMYSTRSLSARGWGSAILGILLCFPFVTALSAYKTDSAEDRGDFLVQEINRYTERHGIPPAALSDLCPDFMEHVPTPRLFLFGNRPYRYDPTTPTTLSFIGYGDLMHTRKKNGRWIVRD